MEEEKVMTTKKRRISCYVPDEIKRKILLRLPVKSLVRFCSVNKRLRHLIATQQFITDHLKTFRCEEDEVLLLLLHQERPNLLSCCVFLDGLIPTHIEDICLPYRTLYSHVRNVGYCNGVVCLICYRYSRSTCEVLFLNPSIRKVVAIPASHHLSCDISSQSFGFGYVEDDYKLVVLSCTSATRATPLTASVFSLKTRNWETAATSWSQPLAPQRRYWKISSERPVFLDGACYWLAEEFDDNGWCTKFMLSFNLSGDHTIGKIVLPLSNYFDVSIHVYDGRLSLIVRNDELCVMNKCGVVTSWTTIIKRMHLLGSKTGQSPAIVGFTGEGGVVYSRQYWEGGWICEELLCYNPTTETNLPLKNIHGYRILSPDRLYAYRQNLVLLDQDVQIPGELS